MNQLAVQSVSTGVPLHRKSVTFLQQAYAEALRNLGLGLISPNDAAILWGCEVVTGICQEGALFMGGEVFYVPQHPAVNTSGAYYWVSYQESDPAFDPIRNFGGEDVNIHIWRRAKQQLSAPDPSLAVSTRGDLIFRLKELLEDERFLIGEPRVVPSSLATNFDASGLGTGRWRRWAICNGQNGTTDRRGRFSVGHQPGDATFGTVGAKGGERQRTLTPQNVPINAGNARRVLTDQPDGDAVDVSGVWQPGPNGHVVNRMITGTNSPTAFSILPPYIVDFIIQRIS